MSCKVKDGVIVIRTRGKGRKAMDQAHRELAEFLWQIDRPNHG